MLKRSEYENQIANFNSKILIGKELEKQTIKFWISPNKRLTAKLLYSFNSIFYTNNKGEEIPYNPGYLESVVYFHKMCDKKIKY